MISTTEQDASRFEFNMEMDPEYRREILKMEQADALAQLSITVAKKLADIETEFDVPSSVPAKKAEEAKPSSSF